MKNRNDYKKLAKEFNEYVDASSWNSPKMIQAELTGFFEGIHRVSSGRNGVSQLLELQTKIIECEAVHFETSHDSPFIRVYLKSNVKQTHGFGRYESNLIQLRDSKGKRINFSVCETWNREDSEIGAFQSKFGYDSGPELFPEDFKSWKQYASLEDGECPKRAFTMEVYRGIISDLGRYHNGKSEKLEAICEKLNFKLDGIFSYSESFSISPKYVKRLKNSIEFGWETNSTYNSLPMTLKLTKSSGPKVEKLSDLGIESAGYYSHNDRMLIRADQAKEAKAFQRKFSKSYNEMVNETINKALKAS